MPAHPACRAGPHYRPPWQPAQQTHSQCLQLCTMQLHLVPQQSAASQHCSAGLHLLLLTTGQRCIHRSIQAICTQGHMHNIMLSPSQLAHLYPAWHKVAAVLGPTPGSSVRHLRICASYEFALACPVVVEPIGRLSLHSKGQGSHIQGC